LRHRKACKGEGGEGKVDAADECVADGTGFDVAGPSDNAGDANAAVVEELFVANVRTAVVADEEDDGVFGEAFVFEALEHLAHFLIEDLDAFQIHGPVFAHEWVIWVIGRQFNGVWIDGVAGVGGEVSVGVGDVVLGIKGLAIVTVGPVDAVEDIVTVEVEISFAGFVVRGAGAVAGVVACIAKVFGDEANVLGQGNVSVAAVVVCANACLITARYDG
jgi:hypothetical protein